MNLKKLLSLNEAIKQALPSTYHKPRLALFEDEDHLAKTQDISNKKIAKNIFCLQALGAANLLIFICNISGS